MARRTSGAIRTGDAHSACAPCPVPKEARWELLRSQGKKTNTDCLSCAEGKKKKVNQSHQKAIWIHVTPGAENFNRSLAPAESGYSMEERPINSY
ncbi:UNVERIFIED_CONTAM: hypothetical protein K2H54_010931 [Gekko kuhli]